MTAAPRTSRAAALVLVGLFTGLTLLGLALTAARASAMFEEIAETGRPGLLRLGVDTATPLHATLGPGESMRWLVEASLLDAPRSTLAVQIDASGDLVDAAGMTAQVAACTGAFALGEDPGAGTGSAPCSGERAIVVAETPLAQLARDGDRFELAELRRDEPRQLLVTVSVPASVSGGAPGDPKALIGLGVHASGEGSGAPVEPPTPRPEPRIAVTGADTLALGMLAAGLVGIGASLALLRRGSRRGERGRGGDADGRSGRGRDRDRGSSLSLGPSPDQDPDPDPRAPVRGVAS